MKNNNKIAYRLQRLGMSLTVAIFSVAFFWCNSGLAQSSGDADYRLAAGDKLRVTVFGHEDLSGEFEVNDSGQISMPLIDEVMASGSNITELETKIVSALKPDYLVNPRVSIEVLGYRPFYIIGEVAAPGSYPYSSGMTLVNAVAVAGGFTYRARKGRVKIVRERGDVTVELEADLTTAVMPGDVIEVPERFF